MTSKRYQHDRLVDREKQQNGLETDIQKKTLTPYQRLAHFLEVQEPLLAEKSLHFVATN